MFNSQIEWDLKYWSQASLSKLASLLGIPVIANNHTMEKNMINYAEVLIMVPIMKKLPKCTLFEDENGIIQQ